MDSYFNWPIRQDLQDYQGILGRFPEENGPTLLPLAKN